MLMSKIADALIVHNENNKRGTSTLVRWMQVYVYKQVINVMMMMMMNEWMK